MDAAERTAQGEDREDSALVASITSYASDLENSQERLVLSLEEVEGDEAERDPVERESGRVSVRLERKPS